MDKPPGGKNLWTLEKRYFARYTADAMSRSSSFPLFGLILLMNYYSMCRIVKRVDQFVRVHLVVVVVRPPRSVLHAFQGFSCRGTELESKWAKIPSGVDILLSHMPPYNVLDLAFDPGSTAKDNPCPVCRETHRR